MPANKSYKLSEKYDIKLVPKLQPSEEAAGSHILLGVKGDVLFFDG